MKRIFAIISVLALLACCITPAFATSIGSDQSNIINYFDYYNGDLNFRIEAESNSITFDLPTTSDLRYLDFTFSCWSGYGLSSVDVTVGGYTRTLSLDQFYTSIYRCYGFTPVNNSLQDKFTLTFHFNYSYCKIAFLNFRYSLTSIEAISDTVRMGILGTDRPSPITISNSSSPILFSRNSGYDSFNGSIYLDNWTKYDYMDLLLNVRSVGLTSLYVEADGIKVPYDVSFFDSSFGAISSVTYDITDTGDIIYYFSDAEVNVEYVFIRVDFTTLFRDSSIPIIHFNGLWTEGPTNAGLISLNSVYSYFLTETISPLGYFFKDLKDFLFDLFNPNNSTQVQIDSSIQENESIDQEISDGIIDVGEDPGDLDLNDNLEDIGADPSHFISFFTIIFNDYFIMRIFWVAALIMIIGYIFHGQR